MRSLFSFLILFVLSVSTNRDQMYCNKSLCHRGKKHIACGNSWRLARSCPRDAEIVQLNDYQKKLFVDIHNSYRNEFALGRQRGFSPASKMLTLQWNDELASLAALNVMQCKLDHDSCRNTFEFRFVGQNLEEITSRPSFSDINSSIKRAIEDWYDEVKLANQQDTKRCCRKQGIGHFLQVIADKAHKIGCAIARFSQSQYKHTLIACN